MIFLKYLLEMTNELRSEVKYRAAIEKVSMNELIVKAVQEYLSKAGAK